MRRALTWDEVSALCRSTREADVEAKRAADENFRFETAHEGLAAIKEEYDKLQTEVSQERAEPRKDRLRARACDLAATAIRFMADLEQMR